MLSRWSLLTTIPSSRYHTLSFTLIHSLLSTLSCSHCNPSFHALTVLLTYLYYCSIMKALRKGTSRRTVEATNMNDTSSRSHTIFKLVVESKESPRAGRCYGYPCHLIPNSSQLHFLPSNVSLHDHPSCIFINSHTAPLPTYVPFHHTCLRAGEETDGAVLVASLNLVDLAGSESVKHTGATGQRAKEGGKINQSLLSLSRVIHALSQQQPGQHVSFRDSKLTRLLQPSLSGNAKMAVVCCITPSNAYIEETRSTLQFASRAKLVSNLDTLPRVVQLTLATFSHYPYSTHPLMTLIKAPTHLLSHHTFPTRSLTYPLPFPFSPSPPR